MANPLIQGMAWGALTSVAVLAAVSAVAPLPVKHETLAAVSPLATLPPARVAPPLAPVAAPDTGIAPRAGIAREAAAPRAPMVSAEVESGIAERTAAELDARQAVSSGAEPAFRLDTRGRSTEIAIEAPMLRATGQGGAQVIDVSAPATEAAENALTLRIERILADTAAEGAERALERAISAQIAAAEARGADALDRAAADILALAQPAALVTRRDTLLPLPELGAYGVQRVALPDAYASEPLSAVAPKGGSVAAMLLGAEPLMPRQGVADALPRVKSVVVAARPSVEPLARAVSDVPLAPPAGTAIVRRTPETAQRRTPSPVSIEGAGGAVRLVSVVAGFAELPVHSRVQSGGETEGLAPIRASAVQTGLPEATRSPAPSVLLPRVAGPLPATPGVFDALEGRVIGSLSAQGGEPVGAAAAEAMSPDPVAEQPAASSALDAAPVAPIELAQADTALAPPPAPGIGQRVVPLTDRGEGDNSGVRINRPAGADTPIAAVAPPPSPADDSAAAAPEGDAPALVRNARPFAPPADGRPVLSVVLVPAEETLRLPSNFAALRMPVAFAVPPEARAAAEAAELVADLGQEVLLLGAGLPAGATPQDAEVILGGHLSALPRAIGMMAPEEGGFAEDRALTEQVIEILAEDGHGLLLWDQGLNAARLAAERAGHPSAAIYRWIDSRDANVPEIRRRLDRAVFEARRVGSVIVVGQARAETIDALLGWAASDRADGVAIAPVSFVLMRR